MLRVLARAKINWSLDILGTRPDGYHVMDMLMSSVDLADDITLEPADTLSLSVSGNDAISNTDNLVLKAARALQTKTKCAKGADITLKKHVPAGAGMGGGSADAAAALIGLNELWQTGLSMAQLLSLGITIGADVPFMLLGGFTRVGGIGEELQALQPAPRVPLVIIQPCKPLSTSDVFRLYDSLARINHPKTDEALLALQTKDFAKLSASAGNVLQQAVQAARPQIAEAIAALSACGAQFAMMTGSGSAVYGAFDNENEAKAAYRTLRKRWRKTYFTHTAQHGIDLLP